MEKIEFYKNRSLGDRFSASAQFIRQNWTVFFKNIIIPAIPIVLILAYCLMDYAGSFSTIFKSLISGNMTDIESLASTFSNMGSNSLYSLLAGLLSLYIYGMSGALMSRYQEGLLTNETKFKDLSSKMFSNMGKIFLVGLVLFLITIVVIFLLAFIMGLTIASGSDTIMIILMVVFFAAIFVLIPPLALSYFAAIYQGAGIWESIKKSFRLGFKYWGSTILVMIVIGIITAVISWIFELPLFFARGGIIGYILALFASLGTLVATPITFVFLSFQYFSIVEKEEGISLQSKVEEFDDL